MNQAVYQSESDLRRGLRWLMRLRAVFASLLLGSTLVAQISGGPPQPEAGALHILYGLIAVNFFLTFLYAGLFSRIREIHLAYLQIVFDSLTVTLIIFVTGSLSSIFSFLYLVVIVYSSILLYRRGSMIIASLCSMQYGAVIELEYFGILQPFSSELMGAGSQDGLYVMFKILVTMAACFAVAFLSSLLSEQARRSKKELMAMEEQVKRVEKMAAVGEMAAGLAHEIKNPLASLSGCIQLLQDEIRFDSDQQRLMDIVLREADRLSALVTNFLMFARPPAGKVERLRLDRALAETVEFFEKDSLFRGKIEFVEELIPDIWIKMDPTHLRQVFWNLLLNAAEAIDGAGCIRIRMQPLKNNMVQVSIVDNGCGMSSEVISSIFDPFFTTKPHGTGLGLSIVHRILEFYGTHIDVESSPDRGTSVYLKLQKVEPGPDSSTKA